VFFTAKNSYFSRTRVRKGLNNISFSVNLKTWKRILHIFIKLNRIYLDDRTFSAMSYVCFLWVHYSFSTRNWNMFNRNNKTRAAFSDSNKGKKIARARHSHLRPDVDTLWFALRNNDASRVQRKRYTARWCDSCAGVVTLRHRHSENGIVIAMMMYDNIVSRKPHKLFSMTAALSTTSTSIINRISIANTAVKQRA